MSENQLVEELEVSRTPIREALHRLQHEGFLQVISNQGIIINEISTTRLHELIDMRIAIETFSLKASIKKITDENFKEIEKIIIKQKKACDENDIYLFKELDANFHKYLLSIIGNYYFLRMFSEAHELQFLARKRDLTQENMKTFIKEHEQILFYLKKKEIKQALPTLIDHLKSGK